MSAASLCRFLLLACVAACQSPPPRAPLSQQIQGLQAALRNGEVRVAEDILDAARQRHPNDGVLLHWAALLADMRGEDQLCLSHYQAMALSGDYGGADAGEIQGRIGELMFRAGRWGESVQPLQRGQVGDAKALRRALLEMAVRLPWQRPLPRRTAAELPLVESSLPELVCEIGGRQRAFVLDTGANWTTLAASMARELGVEALTPAGLATDGTGNSFDTQIGLLHDFTFGDIELGSVPVMVIDDERLALRDRFGGAPRRFTGLVGLDLLRWFRVTFDPTRRSVLLQSRQEQPLADAVPCLQVDGALLSPVRIEGRTQWFAIDTGASHSSFTGVGLLALAGGAQRAVETFRPVRSPGGRRVAVRQVQNLTLRVSGAQFAGVDLPVVERAGSSLFPVHGVLGADLLLRCRVTVDRGHLRLEALR